MSMDRRGFIKTLTTAGAVVSMPHLLHGEASVVPPAPRDYFVEVENFSFQHDFDSYESYTLVVTCVGRGVTERFRMCSEDPLRRVYWLKNGKWMEVKDFRIAMNVYQRDMVGFDFDSEVFDYTTCRWTLL